MNSTILSVPINTPLTIGVVKSLIKVNKLPVLLILVFTIYRNLKNQNKQIELYQTLTHMALLKNVKST